jgi:carbamoyltransferase
MMVILGINQVPSQISWQHDSAAALIKDGKLICAVEEERLNRLRHARGYPHKAVDYCLKEAQLTKRDIDVIAVGYNPFRFLAPFKINLHPVNFMKDFLNMVLFVGYMFHLKKQTGAKIVYVDHHLAHASSSYRCSGYKNANILTIDGSGETESFAFFTGENGVIKRKWDIPLAKIFQKKKWQSVGFVYTSLTTFLGLGVHAEGKTMGLASYGSPVYNFEEILNIEKHYKYEIDRRKIYKMYGHLERKKDDELTQDHKDLAASLQKALEDSVVNLSKEAYEYSGYKNFCFAGGVTLNCNANSEVLKQDFCDKLFIQPAANDGGIALGAALEAASKIGEPADFEMTHAYFGPGYTNIEIEKVLMNAMVKYEYYENIEEITAKIVTEGKIVGWFQGKMEIGPRALGNRSIIADPTVEGISEKINIQVKHREVWRPFAPSIIEEAANIYFEGVDKTKDSSFMLHTFYVKEDFKNSFPAITHVDGSSRIQTVREDQNKRYYTLMKEIQKINGHPIVLDTSFNDNGEPIVCTPKDALRCFFSTGIDVLVIGNYVVRK